MQPTSGAYNAQRNVSLKAALTEIEELKQSQRCVEISLAKQIEENENLTARLAKQVKETEVSKNLLAIIIALGPSRRKEQTNKGA